MSEPLRIRAHPFLLLIGSVMVVGGAARLLAGGAGLWSNVFSLWQLLAGLVLVVHWFAAGVDVYGDRIEIRSTFRFESYVLDAVTVEPAPWPSREGFSAKRSFAGVASLKVGGLGRPIAMPVALRPSALSSAIAVAQGDEVFAPRTRLRFLWEADYRPGKIESWVRRRLSRGLASS